jgi:hypothetical protein
MKSSKMLAILVAIFLFSAIVSPSIASPASKDLDDVTWIRENGSGAAAWVTSYDEDACLSTSTFVVFETYSSDVLQEDEEAYVFLRVEKYDTCEDEIVETIVVDGEISSYDVSNRLDFASFDETLQGARTIGDADPVDVTLSVRINLDAVSTRVVVPTVSESEGRFQSECLSRLSAEADQLRWANGELSVVMNGTELVSQAEDVRGRISKWASVAVEEQTADACYISDGKG